ncbi:MAG: response regulator [Anaerolineae bacterium]|nr:response regulator [Anaerolineae bacterium]
MASDERKRILVVDDEPAVQDLVHALLGRFGYEFIPALNATAAVKVLRVQPLPDLVLLDLMMPEVDGLEFLRQMREVRAFDNLPVIIVSALADPDQIRKGLELGADRYITKPAMAHNLAKTVQEVLRTGRRKP